MSATLIKTDSLSLYAVLHRTREQGGFSDQDALQLEQFAPHLRRAAKIQARLEEVEAVRCSSDAALNQLTFGLMTVDQNGRVLSMNRAAEDIVTDQDGLWVRRGSLTADQPHEATSLLHCIRQATEPGSQEIPRQGASLLITRPSGCTAYRVLVAPLSDEATTRFAPSLSRTALVMVRDPDEAALPPEQHLVGLFGLTVAEAQIALALLTGKRLEDVAEERGVSLGTVRSQFKAILRKTEVDRQAELVRALLTIPTIRGRS